MSALVLTNPYVPPTPVPVANDPVTKDTVAPPSDTSGSGDTGSSTDPSGSGGGGTSRGGSGGGQPSQTSSPPVTTFRPSDATPTSVVAAQTQQGPAKLDADAARRAAMAAMKNARDEALIESVSQRPTAPNVSLGDLPDFAPPDPLPTADVLLRASS